jgi:hypothetical protein
MLPMLEELVRIKEETLQKQLKIIIWLWKKIRRDLLHLVVVERLNIEI